MNDATAHSACPFAGARANSPGSGSARMPRATSFFSFERRPSTRRGSRGLAVPHIQGAPCTDHVLGHVQGQLAVGRPLSAGEPVVGHLGPDVVAEESRRLADGVCDQGFGLGQFECEFLAQEPADPFLDLLRLPPGSGESEQEVVRIPHVAQTSVVRVGWIPARQLPAFAPQAALALSVAMAASVLDLGFDLRVCGILAAAFATGVIRYQMLFYESIELVQVDIEVFRVRPSYAV